MRGYHRIRLFSFGGGYLTSCDFLTCFFFSLRECHLCSKKFQRKQNADIHLLGVHNLTKEDLVKLNRWKPKKETEGSEAPPEYMTRYVCMYV